MKKAILILVALVLTSCSGNQNQPHSLPAQVETTPTLMIETQFPTQKTPTHTPAPTLIPTSTIYNFPSWMHNPDTIIFAASFKDNIKKTQQIYFFNVATAEKFEMVTPVEFSLFFWYNNMNFGIISKDLKTSYKYNLKSGQVFPETIPSQLTSHQFTEQFTGFRSGNMSFGKSFNAEWIDDYNAIKVTDTITQQTVWELPLSKNRYLAEFLWSRTNESHLAFLQGSPEPLSGHIIKDMTLTLVDVATGKVLSSYDGDFGNLEWSPDGKKILYLNPSSRYRNHGVPFKEAPCILFLTTGEKSCLRSIPRVIPTGYELLTTGIYAWSNDSNSIFYTYVYSLPSEWNILGNLCIYSLIDGHINCPTQDLEVLKGRSVRFYYPSPDEQYIYFCYSETTILNDYSGTANNNGMIKIDGTNFFSWIGSIEDYRREGCSSQTLWRPLP